MTGVFRSPGADFQNLIVAGEFTLDVQLPRGQPDQRIEPVERTGDLRQVVR